MSFESGKEWLEDSLRQCTRCGGCLAVCPSYRATGDEAQSARGRATLLMAVAEGRLGLTGGLTRRLSTCLDCGACTASCPAGVDLPGIIRGFKSGLTGRRHRERLMQLAASHLAVADGPAPAALRLAAALGSALPGGLQKGPLAADRIRNLVPRTATAPLSQRLPEISPSRRPETRIAFFPGCAANMFYPETALAAVKVMNALGADVVTPRGLKCCGQPQVSLGDLDAATSMLRVNLAVLAGIDADAVVTICPTCALTLQCELPRLKNVERPRAARLAAKVMDIHQWLAGRSLPQLKAPATETVTWHDPCHLRWGLGLMEEPRRIIAALPGVRYIETDPEGACCGGGGLFSFFHRELALQIGQRRVEEIGQQRAGEMGQQRADDVAGAVVLATGCPSCRTHLTEVLALAGVPARVVHTVELIAARLPAEALAGAKTR